MKILKSSATQMWWAVYVGCIALTPSVGFYYKGKNVGRRECTEENTRHQANMRLTRLEALVDTQYSAIMAHRH